MSLEDLESEIAARRSELADVLDVDVDGQCRDELALLSAVLGSPPEAVVADAVHEHLRMLLGNQVLDFHLREKYDVTYDEYLVGREVDEADDVGSVDRSGDRGFL
ncbi:MAG: hypothetical protein ACLFMT_00915 [Halobacteriales archaeon]